VDVEKISLKTRAVIMKRGEFNPPENIPAIYVDDYSSLEVVVDKAVEASYRVRRVKEVVIAVDPGKTFGAVYMVDNILLRMETYTDVDQLVADIVTFLQNHQGTRQTILLGSGAQEFREKLYEALLRQHPVITSEMIQDVPEEDTSRLAKGRDEVAAAFLLRARRNYRR